ncbi:MAG: uroporphyrinogen decarboxylase [Hyphomicrobiaceae bacterium]|nr:uroporphyrinogen decarboxylase [Hyphomicrobiaceae bacterium]
MAKLEGSAPRRRFLAPFAGEAARPAPIWLMRQAGRYLPEYRATRVEAGSFLDLCYNPKLAAEVTFQPIRRYGLDAAILFSDILVVPDALGQRVRFLEGEGPALDAIADRAAFEKLDADAAPKKLAIVHDAVGLIRAGLPDETALIGFCGAPWTVATYMVGGRGSPDQAAARLMAYRDPELFGRIIDLLVGASVEYLAGQIEAGVDVVQIFDSWAGSLPDDEFERWVVAPTRAMVSALKERHPSVPVIGFPRGAGSATARFVTATGVDGVSCDSSMPLVQMLELSEMGVVVQGNLDPLLLVSGGPALDRRIDEILAAMEGRPFVFNLGHGIVPQTPPEHVARLVERVRGRA